VRTSWCLRLWERTRDEGAGLETRFLDEDDEADGFSAIGFEDEDELRAAPEEKGCEGIKSDDKRASLSANQKTIKWSKMIEGDRGWLERVVKDEDRRM
jgi:hypothetical protein